MNQRSYNLGRLRDSCFTCVEAEKTMKESEQERMFCFWLNIESIMVTAKLKEASEDHGGPSTQ